MQHYRNGKALTRGPEWPDAQDPVVAHRLTGINANNPEARRELGPLSPFDPASHISPAVRGELGKLNAEHASRIRAKAAQK